MAEITQVIPPYTGTPPNRFNQLENEFSDNADFFAAYFASAPTDYNTFATQANAVAVEVNANAIAAADAANTSIGASNFQGAWSVLTGSKSKGITASHIGSVWLLLVDVADITATEPSPSNTQWKVTIGGFQSFIVGNGETLAWGVTNEIQEDAIVTIPLANTALSNTSVDIYVSEKYSPLQLTVNRSGSDIFEDASGTDTQLVLNFNLGGSYRITTDGISNLRV